MHNYTAETYREYCAGLQTSLSYITDSRRSYIATSLKRRLREIFDYWIVNFEIGKISAKANYIRVHHSGKFVPRENNLLYVIT